MALAGTTVVAEDGPAGSTAIFGNALAILGAVTFTGYILAEPVIASFLTRLILAEKPDLATLFGGVVVLTGILMLLRGRRRQGRLTTRKP